MTTRSTKTRSILSNVLMHLLVFSLLVNQTAAQIIFHDRYWYRRRRRNRIIGGVIAGVAGLFLLMALCMCLRSRRRRGVFVIPGLHAAGRGNGTAPAPIAQNTGYHNPYIAGGGPPPQQYGQGSYGGGYAPDYNAVPPPYPSTKNPESNNGGFVPPPGPPPPAAAHTASNNNFYNGYHRS